MPYCPKCRYEYKPTIEICPDCGKKLVAEFKQKKRKKGATLEISEEEALIEPKLKLLYVSRNLIYANFLKETLKRNGIPCLIKRESMGLIPALVPQSLTDVSIFVREEDFGKSCEIKEQIVDNL